MPKKARTSHCLAPSTIAHESAMQSLLPPLSSCSLKPCRKSPRPTSSPPLSSIAFFFATAWALVDSLPDLTSPAGVSLVVVAVTPALGEEVSNERWVHIAATHPHVGTVAPDEELVITKVDDLIDLSVRACGWSGVRTSARAASRGACEQDNKTNTPCQSSPSLWSAPRSMSRPPVGARGQRVCARSEMRVTPNSLSPTVDGVCCVHLIWLGALGALQVFVNVDRGGPSKLAHSAGHCGREWLHRAVVAVQKPALRRLGQDCDRL